MTAAGAPIPVHRFWTDRDAELRLDAGYLSDPEGPYAAYLGSNSAVSLNTLDHTPCLVLLGEPGSGKTTALCGEATRLQDASAAVDGDAAGVVLHADLRDYADVTDLRASVFERPELERWKNGTHRLTLALDSLDEALIEMRKLATRLASELRALPVARLRVRIACRTADWPSVLEHELNRLWGEGGVRVLEIAPLRRRDVLAIASGRLGDERGREFLDAVAAQDAEPFAAKPGTLNFLISSFAEAGRLPASQVELYMFGCRALCEETNPSRRAARRTGNLSVDQRMVVASRVAAAIVLGSRTAVWTGLDRDVPPSDLRRADLVGDEPTPTGVLRVDEPVLRDEVLSTGLFSARGPERLGWAHQTYGEFLAAWWMTRRGLASEQVLALLTMHDSVGRTLVPQLNETAAWVASLRPDLFAAIMNVDPSVLLRSDVARADAVSRERLVKALLDAAERNALPAPTFGQRPRYWSLRHPRLGEQLTVAIADAARPDRVRDLALDIAIACEAREVAAAAADLALDTSANVRLRATAAHAVASAGDEVEAARLRSLALGSEAADEDDDLKGNALLATWRTIQPADLFAALSRAKRPNWSGAYSAFLGKLAESLSDEYIHPGLRWIDQIGHAASPGEERLETAVILRAFGLLEDSTVRELLVGLARRALLRHQPLLDDREERKALLKVLADPAVRHRLLSGLVDVTVAAATAPHDGARAREGAVPHDREVVIRRELNVHALADYGYVMDEDFAFVLDSLARAGNSAEHQGVRVAWGELAQGMLDVRRADHVNAVLERAAAPDVHATFGHLIDPVDLHGPLAKAARRQEREQEADRQKWAARRAKRERETAERAVEAAPLPSAERLAEAVRTAADPEDPGDLPRRRWIRVYFELVRNEKGEIPAGGRSGDVRAGIAWRDASPSVRNAVIGAAATFVGSAAAPELNLDDGVHYHKYAWAGYVALRLLAAEAPDHLGQLDADAWRRWAPTVALAEPYGDTPEEQEAHVALARRAHGAAAETFDAAVLGAVAHALAAGHWRVPERVLTATAATPLGDTVLGRCLHAMERDLRESEADGAADSPSLGVSQSLEDEAAAADHERQQRAQAREARAGALVELLAALLRGGSAGARGALMHVLEDPESFAALDLASPKAQRAFIAARSLLVGAEDAAWGTISKVVEAAPSFARELFLRAARTREVPIADFRERLGVRGVGELFVALARAFPYETDPWHSGVYSPSARDNVMAWRGVMLEALEEWGSPEAIAELGRIQVALPRYDWLAFSVARAREQQGRAAWCPPSPAELFALADERGRRFVRDGDQLLDLVAESLDRYQRELQGDLPAVSDLWDYSADTKPRPRDEGHLADHVARFLKKDLEGRGLAVGCELVVRRGGKGRAPGLRTDIYVTAAVLAPGAAGQMDGEIASVVLEVKGSWNYEVLTAMRTQLVERYLREHAATRRGIYLVGDFTCAAWVDGAGPRRSKALGGVAALQHRLDAQAEELSQGGVRVRAVVLDTSLPAI